MRAENLQLSLSIVDLPMFVSKDWLCAGVWVDPQGVQEEGGEVQDQVHQSTQDWGEPASA